MNLPCEYNGDLQILPDMVSPTSSMSISPGIMELLQDRVRMLDSLMHNLKGMVYCCLHDEEWTMLFVSDGCQELTGYEPHELTRNSRISYEALTFPEDRGLVRNSIQESLENGDSFELEYRIVHVDGSVRWVHERGSGLRNEAGDVEAMEGYIQDITRRKQSEYLTLQAEARYRSIFENATEGIYQTSPTGQYIDFNPALARIYGYDSPDELRFGISDIQKQLYVDPNKRNEFVELMRTNGRVQHFEAQVYRKNGDIIWITENAREVLDDDGNLLYFEGTVEDITEHKSFEQKIEYQATHDSLTGLPNRSLLDDRLGQQINFAERSGKKLAVAFIDLDQFKFINDSMGHHVGDRLLMTMAERLSLCVRESDTVGRLGGDEFVVLLSNIDKIEDISQKMTRILSAVVEPCVIDSWDFNVSCSIGVSVYPDDGTSAGVLLKQADSAMYEAKRAGRNNFQFYTRELNTALMERMNIEYRLRQAIENNEFLLHYQPKVELASGRINSAEALIRWQPPGESMISPVKFIPVAEETGMIEEIGLWVLKTACLKARELQQALGRPVPIAVNVSPRQFHKEGLVEMVRSVLEDTGLEPSSLELEITESTLVQNKDVFIHTLYKLKALGVMLAIDDFGTGYSSMAYLKDFPIDRLKIDKSFVDDMEHIPAKRAILKAIVDLGHGLGIKVVAEGVENAHQYEYLRGIGCDKVQGYYFSRPLTDSDFFSLLAAER